MAILIEEPTAEAIFAALREVPEPEKQKLGALLLGEREETEEEERAEWGRIAQASGERFFEREGL